MPVTFADVAASQYVLLTTFTKDGRPKPTPMWAARQGDALLIITQRSSWKVKRLQHTPRVTVAICDRKGTPGSDAVEATAVLLDGSHTGAVYDAICDRYGLVGRLFTVFSKLRGGMSRNVGLRVEAADQ